MDKLNINPSEDSPKILLDSGAGIFEITGKSLPEDVSAFYEPVLEWFEDYASGPNEKTVVDICLTYFNTASSKILLDILMILEEMNLSGNHVTVNWHYPDYDEDMREAGLEYSEMVDVPFNHIVYSSGIPSTFTNE